jgi:hypothetical protein
MGKISKVKLEFGTLTMGKSARNKIDIDPLNPERPHWAPKMGYSPAVKFEFGKHPKRKNVSGVKFDFEPLTTKGPSGPQNGQKPPE